MQPVRTHRVTSLTFAGAAVLAAVWSGAQAGQIMDAVSPQARANLETVVRHAVEYKHCRGDQPLDEPSVQSYVDLLSEALDDLPQYATLDADGHKVLLINLLVELQQEALSAPVPDCALARVGGQRV